MKTNVQSLLSVADWQAVKQPGRLPKEACRVCLIDMKPLRFSPAHHSEQLGELVCSNSLRSNDQTSAVGLLKEEMHRCNSLMMRIAYETQVPAGKALAVDREKFAARITEIMARPSPDRDYQKRDS